MGCVQAGNDRRQSLMVNKDQNDISDEPRQANVIFALQTVTGKGNPTRMNGMGGGALGLDNYPLANLRKAPAWDSGVGLLQTNPLPASPARRLFVVTRGVLIYPVPGPVWYPMGYMSLP